MKFATASSVEWLYHHQHTFHQFEIVGGKKNALMVLKSQNCFMSVWSFTPLL